MKKLLATLLVLSTMLLAGCGQSGSLYLPHHAEQTSTTSQT